MALTATANNQTEEDIVRNLKLSNPFITRSSFNRCVRRRLIAADEV